MASNLSRSANLRGIVAALMLLSALPFVARWIAGRVNIEIVQSEQEIVAKVNGTSLTLTADDVRRGAGSLGALQLDGAVGKTRILSAESSPYRQPVAQNLFAPLGHAGSVLQDIRPRSEWLEGSDHAYTVRDGQGDAAIDFVQPNCACGVSLRITTERRGISWVTFSAVGSSVTLTSAQYRPSGYASTADLISEGVLIVWGATALWFTVRILALILARFARNRPRDAARQGSMLPSAGRSAGRHVALTVFALATISSSLVALLVLDGIPHVQDEVAYIFQGRIFALGRSFAPLPPAPEALANGFILMHEGKWFTKYPPGFPLLLAPALLAGLAWLVNPLCYGASLAVTYAAGRVLFSRMVALWAAVFGLLSPWMLIMSGSYMSHPATLLWTSTALLGVAMSVRRKASGGTAGIPRYELAWPAVSGFAIAMAFITRPWTALGIGLGVSAWVVNCGSGRGATLKRRLLSFWPALFGGTPPMLFLLYENRVLTGNFFIFAQSLLGSYDTPGFGPGHGDASGHTPALGLYNALVYVRALGAVFSGWPPPLSLGIVILGIWAGISAGGRRRDGTQLLMLGFGGLVSAYFFWWSGTTIYGPRYWYEGMPFLLLLAGLGMEKLEDRMSVWRRVEIEFPWRTSNFVIAAIAVFALLTVYCVTQVLPRQIQSYDGYNDIDSSAIRRAEAANLKNTLLFVALEPGRSNRDFGKVFFAENPLLVGDVIYVRDLGATKNRDTIAAFPGRRPYLLPLDGAPRPLVIGP